jgi:hypothetical protein
MRKIVFMAVVVLLIAGLTYAGGVSRNRERAADPIETALDTIGTCQPEDMSDTTAIGWDQTPTPGGWGGKDESEFAVVWAPGMQDAPTNPGRMAECTISGVSGKTPTSIDINYLQGLANDDFCVFASVGAGNNLIFLGCEDENNNSGEQWATVTFDLKGQGSAGQDLKVVILATGNAWPSFNTWGQLGVDYIKVEGTGGP